MLLAAGMLGACVMGTNTNRAGSMEVVVATTPGSLLSVQTQPLEAALAYAGQRYLITYRSRGVAGEPIVASGYVLLPKGEPPNSGWPVLAWAHGTTGVADICAPSAIYPGGPEDSYHQIVLPVLDWWLAQGYAVIAPDYQGLGTPGGHPYMNAASQLHTVVDAVRALHWLRPSAISPDWVVMGHSQGGAAALEVAAHGQIDMPEMHLRGAIALAPGGYQYADIAEYVLAHPRLDPGITAFLPIVLLGAEAAAPSLDVGKLVSADMQPLLNFARSRCLSELRQEITKSPSSVFRKNADVKPLLGYLAHQSIENMSPTVPVMLIQGTADKLINSHGTRAYYQKLCKAGKTAFYHAISNGSHRDALSQSQSVAQQFLAYLDGEEMPVCSVDGGI
ncbi:Serine aminopeptidase, S33 [Nitrosomonas eutropha]|uniref:Serine aminopeptidase, S33 n=1 Tax=Nitrosomonas eutropha TaxID=916 RepID=A0A1I7FFF5_9PROT|nr:alpha/beta fold hydrolase [Nitrosomonas eutropha]SFU34943.1 Serine aminopeptidase, S33 [Nitrosomonas eutropha]